MNWQSVESQADRWREYRDEFEQLAREEEQIERAAPKDRLLRAYCDYNEHPVILHEKGKPKQGSICLLKTPETGLWMLSDGVSENFQERFRALAVRAGVSLGSTSGTDPEDFWLHRLYVDLCENNSDLLLCGSSQHTNAIKRVCASSGTFCSRLERKALETLASGDQGKDPRDAILKKKARIAEIERILNRPPIILYRGQPVHGGQNWRLRLEEERQHLLNAVLELETELERLIQAGVSRGGSTPTNSDPQSNAPKSEEFTHSDDYRSVTIRSQNFTLTSRQAQVIQILDENRRNGLPEVGKDYLLEKLETPNSRLRDSFKSNPQAWKVLVKTGTKKGTVRLNV